MEPLIRHLSTKDTRHHANTFSVFQDRGNLSTRDIIVATKCPLLGGSTVVVGLSVLSYVVAELLYSGTPLIMDTIGTEESVPIREVSSFQGLNYMIELHLGKEKVLLLERCPHFVRAAFGERKVS